MADIIVIIILVIVIGLAVLFIYREKKKGRKCIGCSSSDCSGCQGFIQKDFKDGE